MSESPSEQQLVNDLSDAIWDNLIKVSLRHYRNIGRFNNQRHERKSVYICIGCKLLASSLTTSGSIKNWQGGHRRLSVIEKNAILAFKRVHQIYHTD